MKTTLAALLFLAAAKLSALGIVDLGTPAGYTPYDPYMHPVKQVLSNLSGQDADMDRVRSLMRVDRNFRYSYTDPYNAALPSVTAATKSGDCKAKALWLCDQMNDRNVRFVVGKTSPQAHLSHAWVMWQHEGRWWVLDPTNTSVPIAAERLPKNAYIPLYSWTRDGEFRHAATTVGVAEVATKHGAPVAAELKHR